MTASATNAEIVTPAPKGLFLAARYPTRTAWLPVGYLTHTNRLSPEKRRTAGFADDCYLFSFLQPAQIQKFPFFLNPEDAQWDAIYGASHLPPPFSTRVRSHSRSDYKDYIASLGLDEEAARDPFVLLARSGGRKHTDWYETFTAPEPSANGQYDVLFFLRGLRHLKRGTEAGDVPSPLGAAVAAVKNLRRGDRLYPMSDSQNAVHKKAIALRTEGKVMIGYLPRHLANDFRPFLNGGENLKVHVERVNPEGMLALMLLCRMTCSAPPDFRPCSGPEFEILSPELRALLAAD